MGDRYTVVDVDAHYIDHINQVADYMDDDDPWKEKFVRGAEAEESDGITTFWPKLTYVRNEVRVERADGFAHYGGENSDLSREDISNIMDDIGINKIVLISDQMLNLSQMRAEDLRGVKFANAYMDYMLDHIVDPDCGIYATIPVPYHDPDAAVELIDRVGDERGVAAICTVTAGVEPPLGNRRYDSMYEAAERANLPFIFHGGGSGLDSFPLGGFSTTLETHTLGFVMNNMAQLTSLVVQGVPEKFPDLDIVFQESGIFYLPMMMYRLDQEYLRQSEDAPLLEKRPSDYMKEFYYSTQPLEEPPTKEYFEYVFDMIDGPDTLMYASDYPHPDYDEPNIITDMPFLDEDEKASILGGNAEEVFGI